MKKGSVILCLLMILCGCDKYGSHFFFDQKEKSTADSWEMSYQKFEGFSKRKIQTKQTSSMLHGEIETQKGQLTVTVSKDGKEICKFHSTDSCELTESGTYDLRVEGDGHKGKFIITW